jgi:hypothetical protein
VTLILSRCRNLEVMDAFVDGIELARATGQDLSRIASVASMFVSRVHSEIDRRLDAIGPVEANALRGTAATATPGRPFRQSRSWRRFREPRHRLRRQAAQARTRRPR